MTCRRLGTSPDDGMFEPPRKRVRGTLLIALVAALSVVAMVTAVSISPPLVGEALAFGGGGGDDDGGDDGGGGGDGDADGSSSSSNDPPPGFGRPKLALVPWLAGDWSRDGAGEKRTRNLISKIKSIGTLLPRRGRPGQPFDPRTAPKWDDRFAIKWHIAPILFLNTGLSPTSPPSSSTPPPPSASPRREGRDEDSGTTDPGGVPIGGTTPALLREGPAVPRSTRPLNDPKIMERAWAERKRQEEVERGIAARAEAAKHERNAVFWEFAKAGAESLQQTAGITITVAGVFVSASFVAAGTAATTGALLAGLGVAGLKTAMTLANNYASYHEMTTRRDNPLSPQEAMKAAAVNTGITVGMEGLALASGGVVNQNLTQGLNKGVALAMANKSTAAQIVTQIGARTGLDVGIGQAWSYVSTEFSDMYGWGKAKK